MHRSQLRTELTIAPSYDAWGWTIVFIGIGAPGRIQNTSVDASHTRCGRKESPFSFTDLFSRTGYFEDYLP